MSAPSAIRNAATAITQPPLASAPEAAWLWLMTELAGQELPPVIGAIGLGDGSLLEALDVRAPGTKVLAIEPDAGTARALLASPRVDAWRQSGRLVYLSGPDYPGADDGWRIFPSRVEAPPMLVHPGTAGVAGVARAVSVFTKIVFGAIANANARRKFAPRYLLNSIRNLPAIVGGRDVRALTNAAAGLPAIVVGAGPSLDASIDELARLRDRAVIIATDTSLRPLLTRGIVPQLVIGLDPSDLNARHLLALPECRDTWLVAESALDPKATAAFDGRTFWFRVAPHHPWPWYNEQGIDIGRLDVWGSVLTGAFQVACLAGCDPIITLGADLSFLGGRPYVRGTTYEFDWAWAAAFGTPVEQTWRTQLAGRNDLRTEKDLNGNDTPTTAAMLQFRDWMVAHARKSGRRLVNASGAGMLFGDGVEQASLSETLTTSIALPSFENCERPSAVISAPKLARTLRTLRADLTAGKTDKWPLSGWKEFSGEGFEPGPIGAALASAALQFERSKSKSAVLTPAARRDGEDAAGALATLAESATRLRLALRGEPVPPPSTAELGPSERAHLLLEALNLLNDIVTNVTAEQDLVSYPDPALIGDVSAGAICMWPERRRWDVQLFEAELGRVWGRQVASPVRSVMALTPVVPRDSESGPRKTISNVRKHAIHACLLLVSEWLRCASSQSDVAETDLADSNRRLLTLEQWLRNALPGVHTGAQAELVIEARTRGRDEALSIVVPLGVSEEIMARVLTGTLQAEGSTTWELGRTIGDLSIAVGVRAKRTVERSWPAAHGIAMTPRRLGLPGGGRLKIADQLREGALCVVDFTPRTVVVQEDASIQPRQTWSLPITGALSLGDRGEVAWNNCWAKEPDGPKPYLLFQAAPGAETEFVPLPFRPARGTWWNDRLYLTCLPTGEARGGIGSWAPGEDVRWEWPDLTLQNIHPLGDRLLLESHSLSVGEVPQRRRATQGWEWIPGQPPSRRALGQLGAASATASSGAWSATAYPEADVIRFESTDGRVLNMRCYAPARLSWAGDSLAVFGGENQLILFQRVQAALEGKH